MRFSLFGQGEGVRSQCLQPYWASLQGDTVTDASISARKQGVRPGMSAKSAQGLLPAVAFQVDEGVPGALMYAVWDVLWSVSPWLETVGSDSFWIQIPGQRLPLREIRDLLYAVESVLSAEQRLRVAAAETPWLARALLEWSRWERIPGASYRKVKQQQLILSPSLHGEFTQTDTSPMAVFSWMRGFPIQALWPLSLDVRSALIKLGVRRLGDLESVPTTQLYRHFGKESLLWYRWLHPDPGGSIRVNYPPPERRESWQMSAGEAADPAQFAGLLAELAGSVAAGLERMGAGALKIGMEWVSEGHPGTFERSASRPIYRPESLLAHLQPGIPALSGPLERLEVYAADIRSLSATQLAFRIERGMMLPAYDVRRTDLRRLVEQVDRKYPRQLRFGLHPGFREQRWWAISESES